MHWKDSVEKEIQSLETENKYEPKWYDILVDASQINSVNVEMLRLTVVQFDTKLREAICGR